MNEVVFQVSLIENFEFDIILVVDGGPPSTFEVAAELSDRYSNLRVIRLNKNYGQHAAILAGISVSTSDLILTMDDDGQHPAYEIRTLLSHFSSDCDLLYGVPEIDEHSIFRNLASKTVKQFISRFLRIPDVSNLSAFRVFRRGLLNNTAIDKLAIPFVDILLFWNTDRISATKITMEKRLEGKTNYNFRALVKYSLIMVTSYSTRPLRLASIIGAVALSFTAIFSIILTALHFLGRLSVPGFASLSLIIMGLGSIQLVSLGLIGEYIGIIHTKLLGKPTFHIRDFT